MMVMIMSFSVLCNGTHVKVHCNDCHTKAAFLQILLPHRLPIWKVVIDMNFS